MRLYVIRHGKAADEGYRHDYDRPLTDEGRARMRRTAKAFAKRADGAPDRWWVSPLVRAVQTCEICLDAFDADGACEVTRDLVPDAPVSVLVDAIAKSGEASLALVSHEPLCSRLAEHLTGGAFRDDFKKGMVLALDVGDGAEDARVAWWIEPAKDDREPKIREG